MAQVQEGMNPLVLREAVAKQFRDCMKGGNGVSGLMTFLDNNLHLVPEIMPLRVQYKTDLTLFETALASCGKEKVGRPLREREDEILEAMGYQCVTCGDRIDQMVRRKIGRTCVKCGVNYTPVYRDIFRKILREYCVVATPEAVLMFDEYSRRANAVYLLFEAVRKFAVWLDLFLDEQTANYFDQIYQGVIPGEGKLASEVKQGLQFLARGNIARDTDGKFVVDLPTAKRLIQLSFEVVCWGYLSNSLQVKGVRAAYTAAVSKYGVAYAEMNVVIQKANFAMRQEIAKPRIEIVELPADKKQYYPYVVLPMEYWENGRLPKQYKLYPVVKPDFYPKVDSISFDVFYGPPGTGKTMGTGAILSDAILNHDEFAFNILSDKSNAYTLASLPMFPYDLRTKKFVERLTDMQVKAAGVPCLTLTFLQPGEDVRSLDANPPTIWDRKVIVDNFRSFQFDWKRIIEEFKAIATSEIYGYSKPNNVKVKKWIPPGLINIRNLNRLNTLTKENADVQVAISLLPQFDSFRKNNPSVTSDLLCDELSAIAPSTSSSPDTYDSGTLLKEMIKDIRRNAVSIRGGTQEITDVNTEVRNNARNLLWRGLPKGGDKSKSQQDIVLSSLQVDDEAIIPVLRELNDKGRLKKGYFWFYLNFDKIPRRVEIVQFSPPTFSINDPFLTNREVFEEYEEFSGQKVLLKSWKEVPEIRMATMKFGSARTRPIYT
jgi:hypothetical protein